MTDRTQADGGRDVVTGPRLAGLRERLSRVSSVEESADLGVASTTARFSGGFEERLRDVTRSWRTENQVARLWEADAELWTGSDESEWLGWLESPLDGLEESRLAPLRELADWADELLQSSSADPRAGGTADQDAADDPIPSPCVVLLGMGGSSLGPEVLGHCFARRHRLLVVDTTDPAQIRKAEEQIDRSRAIVVVSSKSGSTLETNLLCEHFLAHFAEVLGPADAAGRFVAVTDPGSSLEATARELGFRAVVHGEPSIGGRYSVLSPFGLVPAALIGIDAEQLLRASLPMVEECLEPGGDNPGLQLGLMLGLAAQRGRDKLTVIATDELRPFGGWVEQLIAESTGKDGIGVVPIDLEEFGDSGVYSDDRFFVRFVGDGEDTDEADPAAARIEAVAEAGHPVVTIRLSSELQIAQEFFRWEFATAVCGAVLGIHPFDQPDVEAAKETARRFSGSDGAGIDETLVAEGGSLQVWVPTSQRLEVLRPHDPDVVSALQAHLERVEPRDYFAILAYLERSPETLELLQSTRHKVRDRLRVATSLGFGPRYLHSTGQLHKGGPDSGVFLLITREESEDIEVPGHDTSFGAAKEAQAVGDYSVLADRGRRVLRVHLTGRVSAGLQRLDGQFGRALQNLQVPDEDSLTESGDG